MNPWFAENSENFFPVKNGKPAFVWLAEDEGALSVDVYEHPEAIVVRAPIAGVKPSDLDLSIHNDMLTIRGKRSSEPQTAEQIVLHRECHWGPFSRSIILSAPVRADEAAASLIDGVLTITLPKAARHGTIPLN